MLCGFERGTLVTVIQVTGLLRRTVKVAPKTLEAVLIDLRSLNNTHHNTSRQLKHDTVSSTRRQTIPCDLDYTTLAAASKWSAM